MEKFENSVNRFGDQIPPKPVMKLLYSPGPKFLTYKPELSVLLTVELVIHGGPPDIRNDNYTSRLNLKI